MENLAIPELYPVPPSIDAIDIKHGTRFEKDLFAISHNYKVS